ncbi:rhodanese-like domain-containing protein [Tenuifilum thalassicum]|uniref:Rhodanese-like domain-containing protein n=2 Tax=Tenuifilum thalassicum TaxID=2590900 RepID=A0A7D4BCC9_9BACT|nr:rhodanese-like domain-containing protein [Tenuifilum thalassicum]
MDLRKKAVDVAAKQDTMEQSLFSNKGFKSGGFLNLTPRDAYNEAKSGNATIVDVRESTLTGYKQFDVPKVIYLPLSELLNRIEELPKNFPLIIADSAGLRSHEAMVILLEKGFNLVANLAGGIVEWERDGLPLVVNNKERLDGSCMCQLRPRMK